MRGKMYFSLYFVFVYNIMSKIVWVLKFWNFRESGGSSKNKYSLIFNISWLSPVRSLNFRIFCKSFRKKSIFRISKMLCFQKSKIWAWERIFKIQGCWKCKKSGFSTVCTGCVSSKKRFWTTNREKLCSQTILDKTFVDFYAFWLIFENHK